MGPDLKGFLSREEKDEQYGALEKRMIKSLGLLQLLKLEKQLHEYINIKIMIIMITITLKSN